MNQPYRSVVFVLEAIAWHQLASCTGNLATIQPSTSSPAIPPVAEGSHPNHSPVARPAASETQIAQTTGNLLSWEQKAQLSQLNIPVVAPTYLPAGFRVADFDSGTEPLANGSYSYYSILYQGANQTCLELAANTDPAVATGRLEATSMPIALGEVTVYSGNVESKPMVIGLFSLPRHNGYMLRTGGWISGRRCNPVSREEYVRVLKSLELLKGSLTQ